MADAQFVPGQRWVSNTEAELGLGIVIENENRRVALSFPAAAERRVYATDNAPLTRVIYAIGESIANADGLRLTVTERHENNGVIIYGGVGEDGAAGIIAEVDLDSFVQFSRPLDRLFAGQIDKNASFLLRNRALVHHHRHVQSPAHGLLGPRIHLLPHQFYIAKQVGERYRPRVLLADEVGLGKTIEAGLILHQQLLSARARRVLIIVPDNLIHQWLVEMLRRFNLHFTVLDEDTCAAIENPAELDDPDGSDAAADEDPVNPFDTAQLVLVGLSLLTTHPARLAQALDAAWDLLVVDEAHHLRWTETAPSPAYAAVEALAEASAGLVLITATPEQLGIEGHFARLRLLDPDRYPALDAFRAEEANYRPIADLVEALAGADPAAILADDATLRATARDTLGRERVDAILAASPAERAALVDAAIRSLLDRHGTGRVLYRNTRDVVAGFPERRLHAVPLPAPPAYEHAAAGATADALLYPERIIGESWIAADTRVAWLERWLGENRGEKVLVIAAHAATAIALEERLRVRGIRSAVFHEGLGLVARDRAAAYFAETEEGANVLVCSEIGSEGRNFQFAHHLVLFDLPLNPDLLEQRIGRLDRIGQRRRVEIFVPYYTGSAGEVLLRWYHEGLDAIEHVFAAGRVVYERFATALDERLTAPRETAALASLIEQTRAVAAQTRDELSRGRDRLLERNSFDEDVAISVIESLSEATRKLELAEFMDGMFDFFGVDAQTHTPLSVVIHPGDHMLAHSFPGLPEGGVTGTYDRNEALAHEDWHFLTWEHPMVTGAIDLMIAGEFGNATLCALKAPFLKPGTLLLEAMFVVNCPAPRHLQVARYLSAPTLRVVVDRERRNLSTILTPERLEPLVEGLKKHVAHEVAKHARETITAMAEAAVAIAQAELEPLVAAALDRARREQGAERERLVALAAVNPNIRAEEIEFQRETAAALLDLLGNAQLKLDAVRVGLAT